MHSNEPRRREILYFAVDGKSFFEDWFAALKDGLGRMAIADRLSRVEEGALGDHHYVGGGVWELRIHVGPGYRLYYGEDGRVIVVFLCGGDKSTQKRDIRKAQRFWSEYRGGLK